MCVCKSLNSTNLAVTLPSLSTTIHTGGFSTLSEPTLMQLTWVSPGNIVMQQWYSRVVDCRHTCLFVSLWPAVCAGFYTSLEFGGKSLNFDSVFL